MSSYIKGVLDITKGKIEGRGCAAELLGIHPNTLRSRIKKLGIVYKEKHGGNALKPTETIFKMGNSETYGDVLK